MPTTVPREEQEMMWLVVLVVIVLAVALSLWLAWSARERGRRAGSRSIDPVERQRIEEEIRRRHGGSGPTVDGGQHLR
jgi:peptidoglycan/LPS O-acetylase OafA/YrhL